MAIIVRNLSQTFITWQPLLRELIPSLDSYGTLAKANNYFDNHLRGIPWKQSDNQKKKAALTEATQLIDMLSYIGEADSEDHAFPRDGEAVPLDIEIATYEIALQLLQGSDPNLDLSVTSRTFQSVKITYDRSFMPIFLRAGIPSSKAWDLLQPYLANIKERTLYRVS